MSLLHYERNIKLFEKRQKKIKKCVSRHFNRINNTKNKSDMENYIRCFFVYLLITNNRWKDDIKLKKFIRIRTRNFTKNKDIISFCENGVKNNVLNYIYDTCDHKTKKNTLCKNKIKYGHISCKVHRRKNECQIDGMLMLVNKSRYEIGKAPIRNTQ